VARSVWRGSISFGLVTVPVRLYPAVKRHDVRFRELDRHTGQRLRHRRVRETPAWPDAAPGGPAEAPAEGRPARAEGSSTVRGQGHGPEQAIGPAPSEPREQAPGPPAERTPGLPEAVPRPDVVRGYEISPGRFVQVTDEELAALAPERAQTIDVEQFVSRRDLDPIFFDSSYYVAPDRDVVRPFAVLLRALQETNRAAICWLVLRRRRHLAVLQPRSDLMLLTTLLFADEVLPSDGLAPDRPADLQEREIQTAELLLNTLSGPWEPERYRDEYRERILALIEERAGAGRAVKEPEPEPEPPASGVEELMAALTASVEQARSRRRSERNQERRERRRRGA
jgi:DNA end-binding protein Ku